MSTSLCIRNDHLFFRIRRCTGGGVWVFKVSAGSLCVQSTNMGR